MLNLMAGNQEGRPPKGPSFSSKKPMKKSKVKPSDDFMDSETSPHEELRDHLDAKKASKDLRDTIDGIKKDKQVAEEQDLYDQLQAALQTYRYPDHPSWGIVDAIKVLCREFMSLEEKLHSVLPDTSLEVLKKDIHSPSMDDLKEAIEEIKTNPEAHDSPDKTPLRIMTN